MVTVTVLAPTLSDELPATTTVAFESAARAETATEVVPLGTVTTSSTATAFPSTVMDCRFELVEGMYTLTVNVTCDETPSWEVIVTVTVFAPGFRPVLPATELLAYKLFRSTTTSTLVVPVATSIEDPSSSTSSTVIELYVLSVEGAATLTVTS